MQEGILLHLNSRRCLQSKVNVMPAVFQPGPRQLQMQAAGWVANDDFEGPSVF